MSVLLHPNKSNPKRYRVWDRETKTQRYFPLTKEGKREADEFDSQVRVVKNARRLSRELGINKLFAEDGSVNGLKRIYRNRKDRKSYEALRVYATGKQTEFVIDGDGFEAAFAKAINWLLEKHDTHETFEIKQKVRNAKRFYWNSAK